MKWIEDHPMTILSIFCLIFVIEVGIGCWRLPREFRSAIIPKLIVAASVEDRVHNRIYESERKIIWLEKRLGLLSEIEEQRVKR